MTEQELDQIAKMGMRPDLLTNGSDATAALLGNYQEMATPLATPMRTPKRVENAVEQEARNLLRLTQYVPPASLPSFPALTGVAVCMGAGRRRL